VGDWSSGSTSPALLLDDELEEMRLSSLFPDFLAVPMAAGPTCLGGMMDYYNTSFGNF
jgi:hypothetical protein